MKVLVLFCFVQGCPGAALFRGKGECPDFCPESYDPRCGSNGQTYINQCFLNIAHCLDKSITCVSFGACEAASQCDPVNCVEPYNPVCGSDGKTYRNKCYFDGANCHGRFTVAHYGACK